MKQQEAKLILGASSDDGEDILEAFHAKTFEIRNFIFRTTLIPLLAKKRAMKLFQLQKGVETLLPDEWQEELYSAALEKVKPEFKIDFKKFSPHSIQPLSIEEAKSWFEFNETTTWQSLIQQYEQRSSQFKLGFSSAYEADWMAFFLGKMITNQLAFELLISHYIYPVIEKASVFKVIANLNVKIGESILTSELSKGFRVLNLSNHIVTDNSFEHKLNLSVEEADQDIIRAFFTEILRCHKSVQVAL